ncbi:hypothetical protein LINPERPRIM_LOCUS14869 [Linum perenne]
MASKLLRALAPDNLSVQLHLRLLHAWKLADPSKRGSCFGFGTHWVDEEGTTVQGESHKNFIAILQSRIEVGSVYKITGFGLRPPRKSSRTSMFPHYLNLNPTTQFHLQPPTTPPFYVDSFGYIEFEELSARVHPPCATSQVTFPDLFLLCITAFTILLILNFRHVDFVGKVIGGGEPNHV